MARLLSLVALLALTHCGTGGSGQGDAGSSMETWSATFTGSYAPGQCPLGDKGEFGVDGTLTFTVDGRLGSYFAGSPGTQTLEGTGSYSATESVARQTGYPDICTLVATMNSAPTTVEAYFSGSSRYVFVRAASAQLLTNHVLFPSISSESMVTVATLELTVTTATGGTMAGTWRAVGSGSSDGTAASGTFDMTKTSGTTTAPPTPTGLTATAASGQVTLSWAASPGATSYNVYYGTAPNVTPATGTPITGIAGTTQVVTGLTDGTTYYFVITAVNANGESGATAVSSAHPSSPFHATAIAAGREHACAIAADNTVRCWGANDRGQLGNGSTQQSAVPVLVSGITDPSGIAAGTGQSCAVEVGGAVKCWGNGGNGELGDGLSTDSHIPVTVSGITTAVSVTCGQFHCCARLASGGVKCWGANDNGQLGNMMATGSPTPVDASGITTATGVSAASSHTCVLLANGTAGCWGNNRNGEGGSSTNACPLPPNPCVLGTYYNSQSVAVSGLSSATQLSVGGYGGCARTSAGSVRCWGGNTLRQLGDGTSVAFVHAPTTVSGITTAAQVGAGDVHNCAVLADKSVRCWGGNMSGQIGDSTTTTAPMSLAVPGITTATAVTGGAQFTCALLEDQTVRCWGLNSTGQLGNGTFATGGGAPTTVVQ